MGAGHVVSFPRVCQKLRMHSASDHEGNPHKISFYSEPENRVAPLNIPPRLTGARLADESIDLVCPQGGRKFSVPISACQHCEGGRMPCRTTKESVTSLD